jgi:hypothetical protein
MDVEGRSAFLSPVSYRGVPELRTERCENRPFNSEVIGYTPINLKVGQARERCLTLTALPAKTTFRRSYFPSK